MTENDRSLPPNARHDYWYCDDCKKSIGVISGGPACFDCGSKNVRFIDAPLPPPQARTPDAGPQSFPHFPAPWKFSEEGCNEGPAVLDRNGSVIAALFWPFHPVEETEAAEQETYALGEAITNLWKTAEPRRDEREQILTLIDELGVASATVEHMAEREDVAEFARIQTLGREILRGLSKVRDYIRAARASADWKCPKCGWMNAAGCRCQCEKSAAPLKQTDKEAELIEATFKLMYDQTAKMSPDEFQEFRRKVNLLVNCAASLPQPSAGQTEGK